MLTADEQRKAAEDFVRNWKDQGYEKGQSQPFWMTLLSQVYGVERPDQFIRFEDQVHLDHTSFIDGYIPATKVMIEQKGIHKSLTEKIKQSDGSFLTPYEQAKRYADELPNSQRPRWIVTCNFEEFHVHDMEHPREDPAIILLKDLPREFYRLQFLVDEGSRNLQKERKIQEVSVEAGRLVGGLYDALKAQYKDPESDETMHYLNVLCVRLVFCLYAEDSGLFSRHNQFYDYMKSYRPENMRDALIKLFEVLDQPLDERDPYLNDNLAAFPYVNGGLFSRDEKILIPPFNDEIIEMLLERASLGFDWSEISPTIFGAVFESTLNPVTRREGGMHYTSVENIHKVIDPLFLNDLRGELDAIKTYRDDRTLDRKLKDFTEKLSKLTFLDPACGSGNFLTETYLSLRRMENEALQLLFRFTQQLEFASPIRVSLSQFYGIEINDFAVTVARTALWIAEHQMIKETEAIINQRIEFLPLKSYSNIREGNALRLDWAEVVRPGELSYIMGNPPFVGASKRNTAQKLEVSDVYTDENGKTYKTAGTLDYVAGWYMQAARYMQDTPIKAALVSTNSITQGEQVAALWPPLMERFNLQIIFAWRTFIWDSEALDKARVHCVIVGFTCGPYSGQRTIFDGDRAKTVSEISPYLIQGQPVYVYSRNKPLCNVPPMVRGSQPTDDGNLILSPEEREQLLSSEPQASVFIRPFMMGKDFIQRQTRFCLWLVGADPSVLRSCPSVLRRVEAVKQYRLKSTKAATVRKAATPTLFDEVRPAQSRYIAVPTVSSGERQYIPIDYLEPEIIAGNKIYYVEDTTLFHFGILLSGVHMAWTRTVSGRLKSDFNYSNTVVYNNFIWPDATDSEKEKITATAQAILDARALYPESTLADLYNPLTMPPELLKAHQANDRAVLAAYGLKANTLESEIVAHLFKLYQRKVASQTKE